MLLKELLICSVLAAEINDTEKRNSYKLACEILFDNIRFLDEDLTEYSEKMKSQQENNLAQKSRQIGRIISLIAILRPIVKFTKLLH